MTKLHDCYNLQILHVTKAMVSALLLGKAFIKPFSIKVANRSKIFVMHITLWFCCHSRYRDYFV